MGFISEETIQRVGDATDIVDLIGSYFPLKRAGGSFRALCPFHREKSPSFHVTPARQSYHCFGCGAGGGVFRFVMDYEHVDFPTAVRRLAQRAGIPIVEEAPSPEEARQHDLRRRLLALHAEASLWFHHNLLKTPEAAGARDYLKSRGLGLEIAKSWELGYAPESWDALLAHLRSRRFAKEEIAHSGLASSKDDNPSSQLYSRFRDRVMFPIRNDIGEVVAFSGRTLSADAKAAKYVNSPETPLFTKGRVLYGLDKTKRDLVAANSAVVCEGQIDLISAYEAGVRNVIAPQGTAFTAEQARTLKRYVETVVLCFDSDPAGKKAAERSVLSLLSQGLQVRVAALPDGEDPDSLIRKQGAASFAELVANAPGYFDHALAESAPDLADSTGKSRFVRRIGPALALLKDAALREATIGSLAARLALPQTAIRAAMKAPPSQDGGEKSEPEKPTAETLEISPAMAMLLRTALASAEAREWLRQQEPAAGFEPAGSLVDKIARAEFPDGTPLPASLAASLGAAEERLLAGLDQRHAIPNSLERAMTTYRGFQAQSLAARIEGLKSRLADPSVPAAERQSIQKQILDLKIRVADVPQPV